MTTELPLITCSNFELESNLGKGENTNHHPDPNFLAASLFFYCFVQNDIKEDLTT